MAIAGSKDLQVLPDLNLPEIEKALEQAKNEDFEIVEVEGLNHLFQQCETGSMSEYITIQETFNPVGYQYSAEAGNLIQRLFFATRSTPSFLHIFAGYA